MNTTVKYNTDVAEKDDTIIMKLGIGIVSLVGLWGLACLIGGLFAAGLIGTVTGFISAITGV